MGEGRNRAVLTKAGDAWPLWRTFVALLFRKCGEAMRAAQRKLSSSAKLKLSWTPRNNGHPSLLLALAQHII